MLEEMLDLGLEHSGSLDGREPEGKVLDQALEQLVGGDPAASRRWAQEALAVAGQCGSAGQHAAVLGLLASADAITGDVPGAVAHLTDAISLLDSMLDSELERRLDAAAWVSRSEYLLERPQSALRHLDRGLALAREHGRVLAVTPLLIARVLVLRDTGRLAEASAAAEEAAEVAMLSGSDEQAAAAQALRCWVATWTGDLPVARAAAEAAAGRWRLPSHRWLASLTARTLADARLAMGDPEGCLALAEPAAGELPEAATWERVGWYELLTRAELAAGHALAATRWAADAAAAAGPGNLPGRTGLALLARALAVTSADPSAAYDLAVAAHDALGAAGMDLDAARAQLAGAAALTACGKPDQAVADAREAQVVFQSRGAVPFARTAAVLRRRIAANGHRHDRQRA